MTFRGLPQLPLELADQSGKPTQLLGFRTAQVEAALRAKRVRFRIMGGTASGAHSEHFTTLRPVARALPDYGYLLSISAKNAAERRKKSASVTLISSPN